MNGIHHVGATVSDLERASSFYCAVLDGQVLNPIEPGEDPRVPRMVGIPDAGISGVMLRTSAGTKIELLRYRSRHSRRLDLRPCDTPSLHLAFAVEDLDRAEKQVQVNGGELVGGRVAFDDGDYRYCTDPDGNILELIQLR
jgi:predicted enzyme related to lactoylglutathione lyase